MRVTNAAVLAGLLAALGQAPLLAQVDPNTIYGDDDRRDVYQVKDPSVRKLAESTVALFEGYDVETDTASGRAHLKTRPYGESLGLCPEEAFYSQRNGAFCSGSLIAPDIIMTAGHCVRDQASCEGVKFVFGFGIYKEGPTPEDLPLGEVYGCKELLGREQIGTGADWALVRLDRSVTNHAPLALNKDGGIAKGAPVFVIGHPAGLPTKIAGGAKVRDASPEGYFVANTDTFGGNSGSAVFNAASRKVEGILVRGEQDFESKGNCRVSKVCPEDGCRGEDVTKISSVLAKIPPAAAPSPTARAARVGPALLSLIEQAGGR